MTREEIMALDGRALDEAIARNIMGWRKCTSGRWEVPYCGRKWRKVVPHFSTSVRQRLINANQFSRWLVV